MKILILTAYPPCRKTAGQNYTRLLIEDFIKHDIYPDLIYFDYPKHQIEISNQAKVLKHFPLGRLHRLLGIVSHPWCFPLFSVRYRKDLVNYLRRIASNYDILYFDFSQTFLYANFIKHPCKIFMVHDVIAQKYRRKNLFLSLWSRTTERIVLSKASKLFCFSEKDAKLISRHYFLPATVVPFYIEEHITNMDYSHLSVQNYFVFYGAWNRKENSTGLEWFLDKVYPKLASIHIQIIGGGMSKRLQKKLNHFPRIKYRGFIENPYPIIASAQALIAPLFQGAGVKVKVIEALATGTPIIGTSIAFEGITVQLENLFLAETANDFVHCIQNYAMVDREYKQNLKTKFYDQYNSCNFVKLLISQNKLNDNCQYRHI